MRTGLARAQAGTRAMEGASALDRIEGFLRRFCAFPGEAELVAVTLWVAHTHLVTRFYTTPRLALLSPEPGSGKTRVLEILNLLVSSPMFSLSASPAAIFRTLGGKQVTLLFDEVDTIWRSRGKEDSNEDLRALINAGYRRGATIPRCTGPRHEVVEFPAFCATALAGLGDLPDTVMSRSVVVRMRPRAPHERVESFRSRQHEPEGNAIRQQLENWASVIAGFIGEDYPEMPDGVVDRQADLWEPLLAIADGAGTAWGTRARAACLVLCRQAGTRPISLGVRLLNDLRVIFGNAETMHTASILEHLNACRGIDPDAPWADLFGSGLNSRVMARILRSYNVAPIKVTINGQSLQGYRRSSFLEVWCRYLPPPA